MTGPTKNLVATLREGPATLPELADRLGYRQERILQFIGEARAAGIPIHARRDVAVPWVQAKAQPESGAWATVYTVGD